MGLRGPDRETRGLRPVPPCALPGEALAMATKYRVRCAQCAKTWESKTQPLSLTWCGQVCADAWMEKQPAEKRAAARVSMCNAADRILSKIVYPDHKVWSRTKAPEGDN